MSHVMTAQEIARWACSGGVHELSIEQAILRHMEHHMQRATKAERERCCKIVWEHVTYGDAAQRTVDAIRGAPALPDKQVIE